MTIAEQLKIKEFPFEIKDSNGNLIYYETSNGFWYRCEYDSKGNEIYYIDSNGYWAKNEYNSMGNLIYYKNSTGYWVKREYDSKGNLIYLENSTVVILDKRPKSPKTELTLDEIAQKFGIPVNQLKIKK